MNAAAKIEVMDWSKRSAHQWLEQYGIWVNSVKTNHVSTPLATLIDKNDKSRVRSSKISVPCEIADYEAVQVGRLLAAMHQDSREYLSERAWFLILNYEMNWSYGSIAGAHSCSKSKVQNEIEKGLSYLNGKIDALAELTV